mgnify:CR=1 FL=1
MIYILIPIILIGLYLVSFYNGVKTTKVRIGASIQEIGNQLKRQTDLIPNLVSSVKGFLKQEKSIFENLTEARKLIESNKLQNLDKSQDLINKALSSLRVVVESNPQIQSQQLVNKLMEELRDTADKIMYSKRTLIDLTADYNTKIGTIPGIWLAGMFNFKPEQGLKVEDMTTSLEVSQSDTKTPKIDL